jgi:hypothetical protein
MRVDQRRSGVRCADALARQVPGRHVARLGWERPALESWHQRRDAWIGRVDEVPGGRASAAAGRRAPPRRARRGRSEPVESEMRGGTALSPRAARLAPLLKSEGPKLAFRLRLSSKTRYLELVAQLFVSTRLHQHPSSSAPVFISTRLHQHSFKGAEGEKVTSAPRFSGEGPSAQREGRGPFHRHLRLNRLSGCARASETGCRNSGGALRGGTCRQASRRLTRPASAERTRSLARPLWRGVAWGNDG